MRSAVYEQVKKHFLPSFMFPGSDECDRVLDAAARWASPSLHVASDSIEDKVGSTGPGGCGTRPRTADPASFSPGIRAILSILTMMTNQVSIRPRSAGPLRDGAKITSQIRLDRVVPSGEYFVPG